VPLRTYIQWRLRYLKTFHSPLERPRLKRDGHYEASGWTLLGCLFNTLCAKFLTRRANEDEVFWTRSEPRNRSDVEHRVTARKTDQRYRLVLTGQTYPHLARDRDYDVP
jgi:hypothetical protein